MPTIEYLEKRIAGRQKEIENQARNIFQKNKARLT